jgi:hypothetical protein
MIQNHLWMVRLQWYNPHKKARRSPKKTLTPIDKSFLAGSTPPPGFLKEVRFSIHHRLWNHWHCSQHPWCRKWDRGRWIVHLVVCLFTCDYCTLFRTSCLGVPSDAHIPPCSSRGTSCWVDPIILELSFMDFFSRRELHGMEHTTSESRETSQQHLNQPKRQVRSIRWPFYYRQCSSFVALRNILFGRGLFPILVFHEYHRDDREVRERKSGPPEVNSISFLYLWFI